MKKLIKRLVVYNIIVFLIYLIIVGASTLWHEHKHIDSCIENGGNASMNYRVISGEVRCEGMREAYIEEQILLNQEMRNIALITTTIFILLIFIGSIILAKYGD